MDISNLTQPVYMLELGQVKTDRRPGGNFETADSSVLNYLQSTSRDAQSKCFSTSYSTLADVDDSKTERGIPAGSSLKA
ncbi:unnamed protein product [Calypogeia fissa]